MKPSPSSSLPRICVLGSLNIDLVSYVPHHPEPGETLTSSSFAVSPGGKGANQAVACAKLSRSHPSQSQQNDASSSSSSSSSSQPATTAAHVSMVGAVGADSYGELLRTNLSAHGVDVSGVLVAPELKTGIAIILVDEPTGQNRIVLSPEANHQVFGGSSSSDSNNAAVPSELPPSTPDLLIMQLEIPLQTVLLALEAAKQRGVDVLLNPAPAVVLPEEVYAGLAHLVVNETEAAILSGLPVATLDTAEGCGQAAEWFLARGVSTVIITLGGRGVYFKTASAGAGQSQASENHGLVPAEQVSAVVDTTAAGDTFVGQYALEVVSRGANGFSVEAAVKKANKAAARTVERKGASDSIPWRDELV
ncbi:Ribokinase-like protein [Coniella lustricola]|uniref:Ribokinase n=1 Tax=Coniella lustricola TaxID=2025994 RepID=A0A2T2ZVT9_9PEZI|nr:Ribokinase-like protein [Coniella lustricola]